VFRDNRRKKVQPPPALPDIKEVAVIKVIGITFTNNLSVAEHVHNVITSCAQTLYALKVLRVYMGWATQPCRCLLVCYQIN